MDDEAIDVAVLGLGAMGSRVARRLLDAGHRVTVWNRTAAARDGLAAAGAAVASTPAGAVAEAAVVLSMLADDEASRAVWLGTDGAAAALAPDAVAVEAGTVTAGWLGELAAAVPELVAAPVVGSRPQAEAGQLIVLAGGDVATLARVRPVLSAYAGRVIEVGTPADAAAAKLAVNGFFATQVAASAEALTSLRAAGFNDERALAVLADLPITSPPIAAALRGMAAGTFAPMFPVRLVEKDLRYLHATSPLPLTAATLALYQRANAAGHTDLNLNAVVRALE